MPLLGSNLGLLTPCLPDGKGASRHACYNAHYNGAAGSDLRGRGSGRNASIPPPPLPASGANLERWALCPIYRLFSYFVTHPECPICHGLRRDYSGMKTPAAPELFPYTRTSRLPGEQATRPSGVSRSRRPRWSRPRRRRPRPPSVRAPRVPPSARRPTP